MMAARTRAHSGCQKHEGHTLEAKLDSEYHCWHGVKVACEMGYHGKGRMQESLHAQCFRPMIFDS